MRNLRQLPTLSPDGPLERNVRAIAQFEQDQLHQRTIADRIGDGIARFAGSMTFVILNAVWYVAWLGINLGLIAGFQPFDPYPFTFLTLCVSLEAIFLSTFVLMNQNRMTQLVDLRGHINLQLDLLEEQESTKVLLLLTAVVKHLGLDEQLDDKELSQLLEETRVETLVEELEQELPQ